MLRITIIHIKDGPSKAKKIGWKDLCVKECDILSVFITHAKYDMAQVLFKDDTPKPPHKRDVFFFLPPHLGYPRYFFRHFSNMARL